MYGGHPHELRYTEFFGGLGGIYCTPCCGKFLTHMLETYECKSKVDFEPLIEGKRLDKYILHHYDIEPMECSVLLPGSNLLKTTVSKRRLNGAVDLGAKIKPHPLTNEDDLKRLNKEYGAAVLPTMYSGFNVMQKSRYVFTTGASELGIYAMLMNKHVVDISNKTPAGGYYDMFTRSVDHPNQKERLTELLSHIAMGIFLPSDYKEKIPEFLDFYQSALEKYKLLNKDIGQNYEFRKAV
jgi:hypothetical protein